MRYSPAVIQQFLADQSASGQAVVDFCTEHNLKVPTFYSWRRKYEQPESAPDAGFYQITPTAEQIRPSLQLRSGLRVELSGMTASEIAVLILEIERACA